MATSALSRRPRRRQRETPPALADYGLGFHERGGPLVALVGLTGGAGVSTLALLLAAAAARDSSERVFVADTGGPTAGLWHYAGTASQMSLTELASRAAEGLPVPRRVYATGPARVRVVATPPQFGEPADAEAIGAVVEDARASHALTVIDCGTLGRVADQVVLSQATHVVWVTPASAAAADRAQAMLEALDPLDAREALFVRGIGADGGAQAAHKRLERLADTRRATLVLCPDLSDLGPGRLEEATERSQIALAALAALLRR